MVVLCIACSTPSTRVRQNSVVPSTDSNGDRALQQLVDISDVEAGDSKKQTCEPDMKMESDYLLIKEKMEKEREEEETKRREKQEKQEKQQESEKKDKNVKKDKNDEKDKDKSGQGGGEEDAELRMSATLSVHQFKPLWASLPAAGSFQCQLKSPPNLQALLQHLKKNNFHVVFASTVTENDTEIAISNIREAGGNEAWFMARFIFSATTFSAVMKSQDLDIVQGYVKKFALAKVMKIST